MSRMLKGYQRKMVVVQGREKEAFETAYFVLRRESEKKSFRKGELLEEANRIINAQQIHGEPSGKQIRRWVMWLLWFSGVLMGSGGVLLIGSLLR